MPTATATEHITKPTTKKRPQKPAAKTIDQRLFDAWGDILGIVKDGRNDFAKYGYPKADSVIKDARRVLMKNGLMLTETWKYVQGHSTQPVLEVTFRLCAPDTGEARVEVVSGPVCERKGTPPDKAASAVNTTTYTYYLRGLLMLPRVDNVSELDEIDDSAHTPSAIDPNVGTLIGTLHGAMGVVGMEHTLPDVKRMLKDRAVAQGRQVDAAFVNECIVKLSERNS
tara:strand:- start:366 stop:1043 length:678 start_codon:yes stop_codon:yes gene_type:complete